jgi:hypothetical protein
MDGTTHGGGSVFKSVEAVYQDGRFESTELSVEVQK